MHIHYRILNFRIQLLIKYRLAKVTISVSSPASTGLRDSLFFLLFFFFSVTRHREYRKIDLLIGERDKIEERSRPRRIIHVCILPLTTRHHNARNVTQYETRNTPRRTLI